MTALSSNFPVLKNKNDIRTLVFVLLISLARVYFWWYAVSPYWIFLPLIVALTFILFSIKHNHIHLPVFNSKKYNNLFDYILDIMTGNTVHDAFIIHIENHHKETNKQSDWGKTHRFVNNKGVFAIIRYALTTPFEFVKGKRLWMKQPGNKERVRNSIRAKLILWSFYSLAMFVDFQATFMFIIIPNILAQFVLVSFNYFQHNGCDPNSLYDHSRNFTGSLINFLTFNNGFHTAHHHFPVAHWSQAPEIHKSLQSKINPVLNESNFLKYFFRVLFERNHKSADHQVVQRQYVTK
jgi:beta-carotene hydroxylase